MQIWNTVQSSLRKNSTILPFNAVYNNESLDSIKAGIF